MRTSKGLGQGWKRVEEGMGQMGRVSRALRRCLLYALAPRAGDDAFSGNVTAVDI